MNIHTKRNVLMICYYFPPLADVGCRRSIAFAKYFRKHGWNPVVLSVKNPDITFCSLGNEEPPKGIQIEKCYSLINTYWLLGKANGLLTKIFQKAGVKLKRNYFYDVINIPDHFWGWIPLSLKNGYRLIKKNDIDIIYVSCSPFSSAVVGAMLKIITKKPIVIDFRDPFGLEMPPFPLNEVTAFRRRINRKLEKWCLDHADVFIVTPDEIRQLYLKQYPELRGKIFTVYNGVDTDEVNLGEKENFSKFTIVYGGNFYFNHIKSDIFFQAIEKLKKSGRITRDNFQFLYFGHDNEKIAQKADKHQIADLVTAQSIIPYKDMLKIIAGADLQLLRVVKANMGTKIFDGLALNVPMLATIPRGEAYDIVRRYSPDSYLISEDSREKVESAILDAMEKRRLGNKRLVGRTSFLKDFSREASTRKLMRIIEEKIFARNPTS